MPPKFLGSQLIRLGPSIWPVSDFGAHGTPRSGIKTQGGETVVPGRKGGKLLGEGNNSQGTRYHTA